MPDHIELREDEDWATILASDGWAPMDRGAPSEEVEAHIARCFGEPAIVLHETLSKFVHLDIHVIAPSNGRDFTTYVTCGMSDRPTKAPSAYSDWERAELVIALPGPPQAHVDAEGRWHYMIDHLRNYARRPHAMGLCFILGDTIGTVDAEETVGPDTRLSAFVLTRAVASPIGDPMDAFRATLSTGAVVNFLALEPIHADELDLKTQQGSDVLIERLEEAKAFELYDCNRASVAPRKARGFSLKRLLGG